MFSRKGITGEPIFSSKIKGRGHWTSEKKHHENDKYLACLRLPHITLAIIGGATSFPAIIAKPGPDLAGGRPGAQPNYGSISVTGASLGAHKTRGSRP